MGNHGAAKVSKLAELAKQLSEPANFANPANPSAPGPEISKISNISNGPRKETKAETEARKARAERRDRALAELDAAPEGVRYGFVTDASGDPVILTLAIRGVPTPTDICVCELNIPAHRYDWCRVLPILDDELPE